MAFAFVQNNFSDDALTVTLTGVGAGNLIALFFKHEGAPTTYSLSDGTNTFTNGTVVNHGNGDLSGLWCFLLSSTSGSKTYTMTLGAARTFQRMHVWEFSYTGTSSLDVQNTGSGTGTAVASGNITTTGTDEVVLGFYGEYSAGTLSSRLINGVAADQQLQGGTPPWTWERILTATFANGNASATLSASADWICNVIAFKATAAGAPAPSVNDAATVAEAQTMHMPIYTQTVNDATTATDVPTMHMPIHLRMEKL